jgi:hypothetical protein
MDCPSCGSKNAKVYFVSAFSSVFSAAFVDFLVFDFLVLDFFALAFLVAFFSVFSAFSSAFFSRAGAAGVAGVAGVAGFACAKLVPLKAKVINATTRILSIFFTVSPPFEGLDVEVQICFKCLSNGSENRSDRWALRLKYLEYRRNFYGRFSSSGSKTIKMPRVLFKKFLSNRCGYVLSVFEITGGSFGPIGVGIVRRVHEQVLAYLLHDTAKE